MAHHGLGWAKCQRLSCVHRIFSFKTIATTTKQILEIKLKYVSSNKYLTSSSELSQKPFKRKRSIINWAFWRGPGTQMDNTPVSPTSLIPGKLFGLSLSAICENDNLPKPVLVSYEATCYLCLASENTGEQRRHTAQMSWPENLGGNPIYSFKPTFWLSAQTEVRLG